ncbi:hypothetical protein RQP46_008163 [Phenoliferia psychrophenolica]
MSSSKRQNTTEQGPPSKRPALASTSRQSLAPPTLQHHHHSSTLPRYSSDLRTTKIAIWNVNGVRSADQKSNNAFKKYIESEKADIVFVSELMWTGAADDPNLDWIKDQYEYRYFAPGGKVAVLSKIKPAVVSFGFPDWATSDKEEGDALIVTMEFVNYVLLCTYKQKRREDWDEDIADYLTQLQAQRAVIWCGDLNVLTDERDIEDVRKVEAARPHTRFSFTKAFRSLVKLHDLVDVWRLMNPNAREFTFTNKLLGGLRIDAFIVSRSVLPRIKSIEIRHDFLLKYPKASDHTPVVCVLEGEI